MAVFVAVVVAGDTYTSGKESGQVWRLLCLLHHLRFEQKWHSREYRLTRFAGERGSRHRREKGEVTRGEFGRKRKKTKMRDDFLDLCRLGGFVAITSGYGKEKARGERVTETEARDSQRESQRKFLEKRLPDSQTKQRGLQQWDNREREKERGRGEEGKAEQVDMSQLVAWGTNCGFGEEKWGEEEF